MVKGHRVRAIVNVAKSPKRGVVRLAILVKCECGRMRKTRRAVGWKSDLVAAVDFDEKCPNS
jgi:hypothetical protein